MSQATQPSLYQYASEKALYICERVFFSAEELLYGRGAGLGNPWVDGFAAICTMINPIGGLTFGAPSIAGTCVIGHVLDRAGISGDTTQDRIIKFALSFFGGAGIGCLAAFASGFPITFATALVLAACQLGTVFVVSLIVSL